jgi:hypothetical protein
MITITLQDRLNPKLDALAIVLQNPKSAQSTATTPSSTQTPTPMTPQPAVASIPQQAALTTTQQQAAPTSTQD